MTGMMRRESCFGGMYDAVVWMSRTVHEPLAGLRARYYRGDRYSVEFAIYKLTGRP